MIKFIKNIIDYFNKKSYIEKEADKIILGLLLTGVILGLFLFIIIPFIINLFINVKNNF